mgnify:CR=1 FL=1
MAVTPALAYEALSVRSFYMSEAEGGLLLYDLPEDLDEALKLIPGVVENGLFIGIADRTGSVSESLAT